MSQVPDMPNSDESLVETYKARPESAGELFELVYSDLRKVARAYMRKERADQALQADRKHLFGTVARGMRRVLMDHARRRGAERHGGAVQRISLEGQGPAIFRDLPQFLALAGCGKMPSDTQERRRKRLLHTKYQWFADLWSRPFGLHRPFFRSLLGEALHRMAKMHVIAGLKEEETAEVLSVSVKTAKNDWRFAKAWLRTEMGGTGE